MKYTLSYDLGTGGVKASLFNENGISEKGVFREYETFYPSAGFQEQCPADWWKAVMSATKELISATGVAPSDIECIGTSGHSLGVVAVDKSGNLVWDRTPIWSDSRADRQAGAFFLENSEEEWYKKTGNGFPAPLYSLFKIMWYKENDPAGYERAKVFFGSKDYINFLLTGVIATDTSYASGCGAFDLCGGAYVSEYTSSAKIDPEKLPDILPSCGIIGTLTGKAASALGLLCGTKVVAGGVDNACMALGANCRGEGEAYTSLGTSAWIAVSSSAPVLDIKTRPYVFAHALDGKYVSATCIFSAGRSLKWVRETICGNLEPKAERLGIDIYRVMDSLAAESPIGSNRLIFNPSLSGGSSLDSSPNIRGSYMGLDLMHTQGDLIRAVLEGVCLNLRVALDTLSRFVPVSDEMLIVGGGGKSPLWRQIFADVFDKTIIETPVGQDAGALGAAALAAVGCGMWSDFSPLDRVHSDKKSVRPVKPAVKEYSSLLPLFKEISAFSAEIGDKLYK